MSFELIGVGDGGSQHVLRVRLSCLVLGLLRVLGELRNGDGGQNADDGDNDHQLDQGKAFLQLAHMNSPGESATDAAGWI